MKKFIALTVFILLLGSGYVIASDNGVMFGSIMRSRIGIQADSIGEDLIPSADDTYDLGSSSYRWQDGYFMTGTFSTSLAVPSGFTATSSGADIADLGVAGTFSGGSSGYTITALGAFTGLSFGFDSNNYMYEGTSDTITLRAGGTDAFSVTSSAITTAGTIRSGASSTPSADFYDDCTDDDINAQILVNATATGTGERLLI